MPWECGECRQKETDTININTLCHHCGKPLCDRHRLGIFDDAFSHSDGEISHIAFHCSSCKRTYHPNASAEQIITKR